MLGERRNRKSAQSKILSYPACATERSANIVAGYFLIYRPGYISQRVLKHSWSVFALASGDSARRGALSLFHLAPYEQPSLAKSCLISSSRRPFARARSRDFSRPDGGRQIKDSAHASRPRTALSIIRDADQRDLSNYPSTVIRRGIEYYSRFVHSIYSFYSNK